MKLHQSSFSMLKFLILMGFSFAITSIGNSYAHNEPESHELCVKARDYFGCMQSQLQQNNANTIGNKRASIWKTYGPLLVNWSKLNIIDDNHLAPTLNKQGKPIYIAINCTKRKLNVAIDKGRWKGWNNPVEEFEEKLIKDICTKDKNN